MAKERVQLQPRGVIPDQPGHFVPADNWTDGINISFRNARVQRVGGFASIWQSQQAFTFPPEHLLYAPFRGTGYWCICADAEVWVTDGLTHSDISPPGLTPVEVNSYTSAELNGLAVFNNGTDNPFYWPGNTVQPCEELPDWPINTTCYTIRPYKFHLVAMNIDGPGGLDDTYLLWSDAAAPGQVPQSWTIGLDSEAGDNVLGDETGAIIDGLALRDDFIIYKRHTTYIMTYVGGEAVMAFRKLFAGVGVLTRNCVAELNGFHYILSDGDVMMHDGQTVKSIADDRVRETLFVLMDANLFQGAYVVANPTENEIYFCVPVGGIDVARLAMIYSIDSDNWSIREIPSCPHGAHGIVAIGTDPAPVVDWDTFTTFWNFANRKWNETSQTIGTVNDGVLFAQPSGYNGPNVLFLDAATLSNGLVVDSRLERLSWDMGSPGAVKIVRKVWPKFIAPVGTLFTIQVGGQMWVNDGIAFQTRTFEVGGDVDWIDVLVSGRFISITIASEQDIIWELTGFEVEYEIRSRF